MLKALRMRSKLLVLSASEVWLTGCGLTRQERTFEMQGLPKWYPEFEQRIADMLVADTQEKTITAKKMFATFIYDEISRVQPEVNKPATDVIKMIDEIIEREEKILAEYPPENTYKKLRISLRGGLIRLNEIKNRLSV